MTVDKEDYARNRGLYEVLFELIIVIILIARLAT